MMNLSVYFCVTVTIMFCLEGCSPDLRNGDSSASATIAGESRELVTIGDTEKPTSTDSVLNDRPMFEIYFSRNGKSVAYLIKVQGGARMVFNGKKGKIYSQINNVALSRDGKHIAYVGRVNDTKQCMVLDDKEGQLFEDVGYPEFSLDGKHITYNIINFGLVHIVVDGFISKGFKTYNSNPYFNADSSKIVYSEGREEGRGPRLLISDLAFAKQFVIESCGDQLVISDDKTQIATVKPNGTKQQVVQLSFARPDAIHEGKIYDEIAQLIFSADSRSTSYAAQIGDKDRYLVLNGKELPIPYNPLLPEPRVIRGQNGVDMLKYNGEVKYAPKSFYTHGKAENEYNDLTDFVYSSDGSRHCYSAQKGKKWSVVVNGKEGPWYDFVYKPLFSPDGTKVVCRVRKNGKRFVVVLDSAINTIIREHPVYEQIYDIVFTEDGTAVAYGVKDGNRLIWKVEKL